MRGIGTRLRRMRGGRERGSEPSAGARLRDLSRQQRNCTLYPPSITAGADWQGREWTSRLLLLQIQDPRTTVLKRGKERYLPGTPLPRDAPLNRSGCPRAAFAWRNPLHRSDPCGGEVAELFQGWPCRHRCARRAGGLGYPAQVQGEAGLPLRALLVLPPTLPAVA